MKLILLTILLFTTAAQAAKIPPQWRFEYNYGQATTHYLEEQPSILFTNANVKQVADFHQFQYQYFIFPRWLDFSLGANLTGLSVQEPSERENQFIYTTAYANLGILLPISDFWNIKIVAETFYTTMVVKDDEFGFRNLTGSQLYPEVEWLPFGSDTFMQITPYLKVPLITDVGNRKETTIGLKLSLPLGSQRSQRYPTFAYQKSFILRVFYTHLELEFEREDFIPAEIDVRQIGATLGFNF